MGKTIEDIKREYGLSDMSFIEAHFGMKPKWFFFSMIICIVITIIVALLISN